MNNYEELPQIKNKTTVMEILKNIGRDFQIEQGGIREQPMQSTQIQSGKKYKKPIFTVNEMQSTFLTLNKSLLYVGDNSTFQKRITWILAIQWITFSFMVNTMAFFLRAPSFLCQQGGVWKQCTSRVACSSHSYKFLDNNDQISITAQFGLVCQKQSQVSIVQTFFFLGGFISGFILQKIAERIGRRPVILGVLIINIIAMSICAWAPTFIVFKYSYFVVASCLFGYQTIVIIYITEISAVRFKTFSVNILTMVWAGTPVLLPFLRLIPTWRISFAVFALIWAITFPFAYFCFLQSPRFLLIKQCYSQVRSIFQKISITNRRPPYRFRISQQMQIQNQKFLKLKDNQQLQKQIQNLQSKQKKYGYLDLFRYSSLKKATLALMYMWMFRFFMYFSLNLSLEAVLKSQKLLTYAIATSSISQAIGTSGLLLMTICFARKYSTIQLLNLCMLILTGLCGLLWFIKINFQCQQHQTFCFQPIIMIILVCFIKFFSSIFFSTLITYSSQVYPTAVRLLGYVFVVSFGRIGTLVVPFYIQLMRQFSEDRNALVFLFPFGIIGYIICCFMPKYDSLRQKIIQVQQQSLKKLKQIQMSPLFRMNKSPSKNFQSST